MGDWDHFGTQNAQNMYGYKPENGPWELLIWDHNIVIGNSSWGPGANLFSYTGGDSGMANIYIDDMKLVDGSYPSTPVTLNEWMASNTHTVADPADDKFDDWFELYNAGITAVNLTGFTLSNSANAPGQFVIPSGYSIPAGGYLLVWADKNSSQNLPSRPDLHVNFNLNKAGEFLGLYAPNGSRVDSVIFGAQTLTFTLDGGAPAGATVTAEGQFSWTPTLMQSLLFARGPFRTLRPTLQSDFCSVVRIGRSGRGDGSRPRLATPGFSTRIVEG